MSDNTNDKVKRATMQGMATLMIAVGANALMMGMLPEGGAIFAAGCVMMFLYEEYGVDTLPDIPPELLDALQGQGFAHEKAEELQDSNEE